MRYTECTPRRRRPRATPKTGASRLVHLRQRVYARLTSYPGTSLVVVEICTNGGDDGLMRPTAQHLAVLVDDLPGLVLGIDALLEGLDERLDERLEDAA